MAQRHPFPHVDGGAFLNDVLPLRADYRCSRWRGAGTGAPAASVATDISNGRDGNTGAAGADHTGCVAQNKREKKGTS